MSRPARLSALTSMPVLRRARSAVMLATGLALLSAHAQNPRQTATPMAPASTASAASAAVAAEPAASMASAVGAAARMAREDRVFVEDAASAGLAEVMLGRLAQQRAANAEVKQYGEQMVADHGKANDELMALARARGVQLKDTPTAAQKRLQDNMAKLEGAAFDRLYMATMLSDHRKAVSLFSRQARSGKDAELRAFAQKTLPTLQAHLKMTSTLHDRVDPARRR